MGQTPDLSLTAPKRFTSWASPSKVKEMIAALQYIVTSFPGTCLTKVLQKLLQPP